MFAVDGASSVFSLAPLLTLVLALGGLLAFTRRFRRAGTTVALLSALLVGAAFLL